MTSPIAIPDLTIQDFRDALRESNRRGHLPEIEWSHESEQVTRSEMTLVVPSIPLLSVLRGRVETNASELTCEFQATVDRRRFARFLVLQVVLVFVSTWLTDIFCPWMYAWWWVPATSFVALAWIGLTWPAKSERDAQPLVDAIIQTIESTAQAAVEANQAGSDHSSATRPLNQDSCPPRHPEAA